MTGKPTIRDRLAAEAEQYLDVVEAFAAVEADPHPMHGHPYSLCLQLPPLAVVIFTAEG